MASNTLAPIIFPNTELSSFEEIFENEDVNNLVFPNDDMVYIFKMEDLSEPSVIGSSMHVVRRYLHVPSGNFMAVKQIHIPVSRYRDETKEKRLQKLNLEIYTHREIANSPYIVDFYGLCLHEGCALVCMELMDVSLHGLLTTCHNSGKNIPEDLLGYTAVSILEALNVCKSKGIIHRDIKPENILIKKSGEIKLADFGESRFVGESQKVTTIGAGTIRYWPPERLYTERTKYDIRSDIWSFGLTLAEMAYGKYPMVHADDSDIDFQTVGFITLQNRILEAKADEIINRCVRSKYSEDLCEFIRLCLQKLEDRANVEELKETELYERFQARNTKWVAKLILQEYDFANDPNLYENNHDFLAENNFYEPAKNTNHHLPPPSFMAVKQIHIPISRYLDETKEKRLRKLNLEIHTHREIANSPYIVDFYGLCLHDGWALLCMELMDMSLHGLLTTCLKSGKNIPEDLLGCTAISILGALNVCKSNGIIHRDIKPENILIKKSGEIKLADFGESRFVGESQKVTTIGAGTIRYWPPERLYTERTKYDIRSDIWSFGLTLAEMAYGKYPIVHADGTDIDFQTVDFITLQNRILEAKADEIINRCVRSKYSEDLCEFIWLCLQKLEDRANVEELKETELYERFQARNTKLVAKLILQALENDFANDPNLYGNKHHFSAENNYENFYEPAKNTNHHFPPSNYDNPIDTYEMPRKNINTYDKPPILPTTKIKPQRAYSIPELQLPIKRVRSQSLWARIVEFISAKKCYFIFGLIILLVAVIIVAVVLVPRKPKTNQEGGTTIISNSYSATHPYSTKQFLNIETKD